MKIEALPVDALTQRCMDNFACRLKEKREADPAYQRSKMISKDEARAMALDWLAKEIKDFWHKQGKAAPSYEAARREAHRIANRAINQMEWRS